MLAAAGLPALSLRSVSQFIIVTSSGHCSESCAAATAQPRERTARRAAFVNAAAVSRAAAAADAATFSDSEGEDDMEEDGGLDD